MSMISFGASECPKPWYVFMFTFTPAAFSSSYDSTPYLWSTCHNDQPKSSALTPLAASSTQQMLEIAWEPAWLADLVICDCSESCHIMCNFGVNQAGA